MRKLLVVTYSYAPMLNARAFRWTAIAENFAARGWEVDVVCGWQPDVPAQEALNGVNVSRVGWRMAERARGQRSGAGSAPRPSLLRRLWRQVYWPDFASVWYWPARAKAAALLGERAHDALVAVSPAFTAVLAAHGARRAHPQCRWLIDIGDPFSLQVHLPPNNAALYASLNRRVERSALDAAEAIAVTTARTAQRYAAAFPGAAHKLHVIPPLLSIAVPEESTAPAGDGRVRRLVYIGRLYRGLREPRFLLELFRALCARRPGTRYELHLYGEAREFEALFDEWRARLDGRLVVHGMQPREVAAAAANEADVLVNVGNESADQLPSKLVEYAAAGKPILNLARQDDASVEFLADYPDRLTLFDRGGAPQNEQVNALARFVEGLPRAISREQRQAWISAYQLPAIAARYEALLA